MVWEDSTPGIFEIFYTRSTDGGANFTPPESLSINTGSAIVPGIAALAGNVYVVWAGENGILFRKSTTSGDNFDPSMHLGSGNGPIVTSLGNNVYVVWGDPSSGNWEILYRKSIDSGVTFDPTASNLSTNSGTSDAPAIAVS